MFALIFIFATMLWSCSSVKFYVASENIQCAFEECICDGNATTPFKNILAALQAASDFKEKIEKERMLEILLQASAHIISENHMGSWPLYFSPFANVKDSAKIIIGTWTSGSEKATISLRTERLKLDFAGDFEISNIKIEARDLPASNLPRGCLDTESGCCSAETMFYARGSFCQLYKRNFLGTDSISLFKFFRGPDYQDAKTRIKFTNVSISYFNPLRRYVSLVAIDTGKNLEFIMENITLDAFFLKNGLISFFKTQPVVQIYEASYNITNLTSERVNSFFIGGITNQLQSFFYSSSLPLLRLENISILFFSFNGAIISARNTENLFLDHISIDASKAILLDLYACANVDIKNLAARNIIVNDSSNLNYFISIEDSANLLITAISLKSLNLISLVAPINLIKVEKAAISTLFLQEIKVRNIGFLRIENLKEILLRQVQLRSIISAIHGLVSFWGYLNNYTCQEWDVSQVYGGRGAIYSSTRNSKIYFFSFSNSFFANVMCRVDSCIELQSQVNMRAEFNKIAFQVVSGNDSLIMSNSPNYYQPRLTFNELSIINCSTAVLNIKASWSIIIMKNFFIANTTSFKPLLLNDRLSDEISFINGTLRDCSADFYLLYSQHFSQYFFYLRILNFFNVSAFNLKNSSIIWVFGIRLTIKNCRFSNLQTATGFGLLTLQYINMLVEETIFENMNILLSILAYIFYNNYDFYFKNSVFRDMEIPSIGALVAVSQSSRLYVYGCLHYRIRGKSVSFYMGIIDSYIEISNCSFWQIEFRQRGMILLVNRKTLSIITNSKFSSITGGFNGPIGFMDHQSQLDFRNCRFSNITGSKGGLFQIFKNTTLLVDNSFFLNCLAYIDGGIISTNEFFSVVLKNSFFQNIKSFSSGGVLFISPFNNRKNRILRIENCSFNSIVALLDGAVAYISNLNLVSFKNVSTANTSSMNGGCLHLRFLTTLTVDGCLFKSAHADEKAGGLFFERVQNGKLINLVLKNISNYGEGVLIYSRNSVLNITSASIKECFSSASGFIYIYNSGISDTRVWIQNMSLEESEGKSFFFQFHNELTNLSALPVTIINFTLTKNSFYSLMAASRSFIQISNSLINDYLSGLFLNTALFNLHASDVQMATMIGVDNDFDTIIYGDSLPSLIINNFNLTNNRFKTLLNIFASNSLYLKNIFCKSPNRLTSADFFSVTNVVDFFIHSAIAEFTSEQELNKGLFSAYGYVSLLSIKKTNAKLFNVTALEFASDSERFITIFGEGRVTSIKNLKLLNLRVGKSKAFISIDSDSLFEFQNISVLSNNPQPIIIELNQTKGSYQKKNISFNNLKIDSDVVFDFQNINFLIAFENSSVSKGQANFPVISLTNCRYLKVYKLNVSKLNGETALTVSHASPTFPVNITIENSVFRNCISSSYGGALKLIGRIDVSVRQTEFLNNFASQKGGALYFRLLDNYYGSLEIIGSTFVNCTAGKQPGAIRINSNNKGVVDSFTEIIQKNSFASEPSKYEADLPIQNITYWPSKYSLSLNISGKPVRVFNNFEENQKLQDTSIEIFSGQKIEVEVEFFDHYLQKTLDFDSMNFICSSPLVNLINYTLTFDNNNAIVRGNKATLPQMQISSDKSHFESHFFCQVTKGAAEQTDLDNLITTSSLYFYMMSCQIGQVLREKKCVYCMEKTYSFESNITSLTNCYPCPRHALCFNGTIIQPEPGYWNFNSSSLTLFPCEIFEACPGGREQGCSEGYAGILCLDCADGFGKLPDFSCVSCGNGKGVGLTVTRIMVNLFWLLLLFYFRFFRDGDAYTANQTQFIRHFLDYIEYFTIIFSMSFKNINLFKQFHTFVSLFSFFGNFNFIHDCIFSYRQSHDQRFILNYLTNLAVPLFFTAIVCSIFLFLRRLGVMKLRTLSVKFIVTYVTSVTLYSYWMNNIRNSASAFMCTNLFTNKQLPGENNEYLSDFPNLKCYSHDQDKIIPFVSVILAVYFISILTALVIIHRNFPSQINYFNSGEGQSAKTSLGLESIRVSVKLFLVLNYLESRFNVMTFNLTSTVILIPAFKYLTLVKHINFRLLITALTNFIVIFVSALLLKYIDSSNYSVRNSLPIVLNTLCIAFNIVMFCSYSRGWSFNTKRPV